jgi:hypothetical protein
LCPTPSDRIAKWQEISAGCIYIPTGIIAGRNESESAMQRIGIELEERPEDYR